MYLLHPALPSSSEATDAHAQHERERAAKQLAAPDARRFALLCGLTLLACAERAYARRLAAAAPAKFRLRDHSASASLALTLGHTAEVLSSAMTRLWVEM